MSAETITTISPTTNRPVVVRTGPSAADLGLILSTAASAFLTWRATPLADRQIIVRKALALLSERQDVLAKELTEHMGRPIAYTAKEVATAVKRGEYLLKVSGEVLAKSEGENEAGFVRYICKEPMGPVLVIYAWNYPYLILINSIIPALLAGNTVILKPSPQTPTTAEHISEIFAESGLPLGVLQFFQTGVPSTVETVVRDDRIRHVCFTGSVAAGLAVQRAAADRVVNVGLELGGKDPAYVRADVDVNWAAEELVDGAIFNSGQSCCSVERVYVHEKVYDKFVTGVKNILAGYRLGNPMDTTTQIGPVVSQHAKRIIEDHIKDALAAGAKDETPPNETFDNMVAKDNFDPAKANIVRPTLLTGVNHSMTVMTEETFGPVIPVMKVKDDDEAVRLMNDSQFGLTASIWTRDLDKGREIAAKVEAGTVFVNRCDYPSPDLAWTGWKNSGRGVTLSRFGFDQFVKLKSFHLKNHPN